jgi:hypothetical protein
MTSLLWAIVSLAIFLAQPINQVRGETLLPKAGLYSITFRLELPHLERWAIEQTKNACLSEKEGSSKLPIPIMSANHPFESCIAANLTVHAARLEYDIVCPGRDAARAHATYTFGPDWISGRVAMVMGAKNMTMTEVQYAKRFATCNKEAL